MTERCGACLQRASTFGAGAIAVIQGRALSYLLCERCAERARREPEIVAEIVEHNYQKPQANA